MTRVNLFTHPSAEGAGITWTSVTNTHTVTRSTAQAWVGTESYRMTTAATGSHEHRSPAGTSGFPVTAGLSYALSLYTRGDLLSKSVTLKINWYAATGASLTQTGGTALSNSATLWTRHSLIATAPAGAAFCSVQIRWSVGLGSAETHYFDGILLEQSSTVLPYFDGGSTQVGYTYAWTGTAHASTSTENVAAADTVAFKRYESGSFVSRTATPKAWNGTAWVVRRPKRWNGSAWVDLP